MTHSPTSRSGRPLGAAGPLVSLLVGLMAVVGLGCAAVGVHAPVPRPTPPTADVRLGSCEQAGRLVVALETSVRPPSATRRATATSSRAAAGRRSRPRRPLPDSRPSSTPAPGRRRARRAAQPVRLRIAEVDLDVEVRPTGVAEDGSMELPDTVRRAGWYRFGATPSEPVRHHRHRRPRRHPRPRVSDPSPGSAVGPPRRPDRRHRPLRRRARVPRSCPAARSTRTRLPVDDLFDRDGPPRLVVLTCGGAYDARNGYHDNIVVIAEPDR